MLKGLQELDLTGFKYCKNLREVIVDVGELSSLKILRTKGASEVEYETPIGLKELSTSSRISNLAEMLELEVLEIYDCKFGFYIPPMWWEVSKLKFLSIVRTNINGGGSSSNNNMITTMLPSSLTYLRMYQCHAWLPSLVNLGNLTLLEMDEIDCQTLCNHLDGIEGLTSLKKLRINEVKGLARITGLTNLLSSPDCKLEHLDIVYCLDLTELPSLKLEDERAVVVVNSLRVMNIVHCPQLDAGPLVRGLTKFPMLWILWLKNIKFTEHQLEGVGSLEELEYLILKLPSLERITPLSKLQKLKELTIAGAHGLREIEGLGELKSLEYLRLPNCSSLERLWHADDRLENLKKLDIRNCRSLSVEHLSALEAGLPPNVEIRWPDKQCEDDEIDSRQGAISDEVSASVWSHLSKYNYALDIDELIGIDDHVEAVVEKLSMDSENMIMVGIHGGLPLTLKVIGSMLYREELAVWQEKLEQLRGTIEHQVMERLPRFPRSLEILRLSFIEGPELDIGDLKKLKVLYLNYSILQKITGGTFGMLKGLQELDLSNFKCKNLREVIVDVGELSSLKILRTKGARGKQREVEYETPIGLKELSTSSRISNLAKMLELEVLKIDDCKFGFDIPPMWWKRSKLKTLWIVKTNINGGGSSSNNNMITTMLPSSLTYLHMHKCHAWLPSLVNLGNLTLLKMVDCQTLCNHLDGIEGLTSLKDLRIKGVKGLARITGLTNLLSSPDCKLDDLTIFSCPDLIELHDDDKVAEVGVVVNSLRLMHIIHCPQLDAGPLVRGLTKFPMLRALWLENIKFTEHQLEGFGSLKELKYCILKLPSLERITPLSKLQKLKELTIAGAHGLREIEGLGELKRLETLILPNCTSLERLWHADDRLENLKKLDIRNCRSLSVEHLSALQTGESWGETDDDTSCLYHAPAVIHVAKKTEIWVW
ncbi:Disease resistance protein L6 [Linum perenne]